MYEMGEQLNVYAEPMEVSVNFGGILAFHDKASNSLWIENEKLRNMREGYHKVTITGSYIELDGSVVTFTKPIYLWIYINDKPENLTESSKTDPTVDKLKDELMAVGNTTVTFTRQEIEQEMEFTYVVT